mgnify:CR=1 FL=1
MTTVLVTGGAGFIATHTDIELLDKGYDVISVDNYGNSSPVALERVEQITGKPVKRYDGDVRDEALMERVFTENNIDWVIHFAGLKAVGESVAKPIEYYDNNLYSTLVLLKVMKKHNVKKIIFSSSATVYGTPKELPITEETPTGGTTNHTAPPSCSRSRFCATYMWPIRPGPSCCCATSTGRRTRVRPAGRRSEGYSGEPHPVRGQGRGRRAQGSPGLRRRLRHARRHWCA